MVFIVYWLALIFLSFTAVQIWYTVSKGLWKESIVSIIVMAAAAFFAYNRILDWNLPEPGDMIVRILDPISRIVFGEKYIF
ncbi:MAG: hypothetical protein N3B21_06730 [Clostridia bacterium]|nr:hypothetical protein [Clostridia bacterium]